MNDRLTFGSLNSASRMGVSPLRILSLMLVPLLALISIIGIDFFVFDRVYDSLDETENERSRVMIGEAIVDSVVKIEAKTYLFAMTSGKPGQDHARRQIEAELGCLEEALNILENGGTLTRRSAVNSLGTDILTRKITYERHDHDGEYLIEVIDLRPRIAVIRARIDDLGKKLEIRDALQAGGDMRAYADMIREIKEDLTAFPQIFSRMNENASRLFEVGRKRLESIENRSKETKRDYFVIQVAMSMAIIFVVFFLGMRTVRRVNETNAGLVKLAQNFAWQGGAIDRHVIVSVVDEAGILSYVNDHFVETTGFSRDEVIGKSHAVLGVDDLSGMFFRGLGASLASSSDWSGEMKLIKKSGEPYWASVTVVPMRVDDNDAVCFMCLQTDITAHKEMEERIIRNNRFLTSLTESMGEGVFATDDEGRCTFSNKRAEMILGWSKEEMIGRNFHDVIHQHAGDARECPIVLATRTGCSYRSEDDVFRKKNGQEFPVSVTSVPLMDGGEAVGAVTLFKDISLRKESNRALSEAKEAAERSNRTKSEFLANMSHEIRTPMNAVIGLSHLLMQTALDAGQADYVRKIQRSAKLLLGIINDILDFSKIEADRVVLEQTPFALEEVVDQVISMISMDAEQKGIEVLIRIDPTIPGVLSGDALRLQQVLGNLMSNAVKFTDEGSVVLTIKMASNERMGVRLAFEVADTGIGLTGEQIGGLFSAFSQADCSTTRRYGGTGLGLVISKRLVGLMNGQMSVRSEPGVGSTFMFSARFSKAEQGKAGVYSRSIVGMGGMKALVIDDSEVARDVFADMLAGFGMSVDVCPSGEAALDRITAENCHYDFLVVDWKMNGIDGIETIRRIREIEGNNGPAVVLATAGNREEAARLAEDIAKCLVLAKPVTPSTMFDSILAVRDGPASGVLQPSEKHVRDGEEINDVLGLSILVAEDNEINQMVVKEMLEGFGASVALVGRGDKAVEAVRTQSFDLVLMDIQMPGMDGYEATRRIRDDLGNKAIPVIALTAHALDGDSIKSIEAGMNDHITKPIDPEVLLETVARWGRRPIRKSRGAVQDGKNRIEGVIDVVRGQRMTMGNSKRYLELLQRFVATHGQDASKIRESIVAGRLPDGVAIAHSMRGIGGTLGIDGVFALGTVIEQAIETGKEMPEAEIAELETILEKVSLEVFSMRKENETMDTPVQADLVESETPRIEHMLDLIEAGDLAALDEARALYRQMAGTALEPISAKIVSLLGDVDFEGAGTIVRGLFDGEIREKSGKAEA